MKHYLELTLKDWQDLLVEWSEPSFRAKQIFEWIYKKSARQPEDMTNLSKALRQKLIENIDWKLPEVHSKLDAADQTTKLLLLGERRQFIETVIMRYEDRTTICVSSQVGCKLACSFCQTGKLGFFRNLSTAEILSQLVLANEILKPENRRVTNIVFMGMGEPLDNYENSIAAANRMISPEAFGLSARHVTISTSGIAPKILSMAVDTRASLAVSLHAATESLRTELMPINKRYGLDELHHAIKFFQQTTNRRVTIEYIMISGVNVKTEDARALVRFLQGISAKVNLIPFNAHPGLPYQRPSDDEIRSFQKFLADRSIPAPVRYSRGLDVSAACGQLAAKNIETLSAQPQRKSVLAAAESSLNYSSGSSSSASGSLASFSN